MVDQNLDSLQGPGDAPLGRRRWSSMAPLAGAVVLISMLASAIARAFQTRGLKKGAAHQDAKTNAPKSVVVKRGAEKPADGRPGGFFTGSVGVDRLFPAQEPSRAAVASVTFEPGARTVWHSHPLGQTLKVAEGTAWVQGWGARSRRFGRATSSILPRTRSVATGPRRRRA